MKSFFEEFAQATFSGLKSTFDFHGSASKREFWFFLLFFFVAYAVVWVVDDVFLKETVNLKELPVGDLIPAGYFDSEVGLAVLLFRPIMFIPTLSATVRRLHDVGKSGWWSALWIFPLPVLGWFWLIPWLLRPSQQE